MTMLTRTTRAAVGLALVAALVAALTATAAASAAGRAAGDVSVSVSPSQATPGSPVVVTLTLPVGTAAADGRVLFDESAAEFVGVAPLGGGTALYPEPISGGVAFGAYGLHSQRNGTILRFILEPTVAGSLQVRVLVDDAANAGGSRLAVMGSGHVAAVAVAGAEGMTHAAPKAAVRPSALRAAVAVREQFANGRIDKQDLASVRAAWDEAALDGGVCGSRPVGDANGDGCVDIVDVQATFAALGHRAETSATQPSAPAETRPAAPAATKPSAATPAAKKPAGAPAPTYAATFVVNSAADTNDALPGDGICADSTGACTLRAALTEASWQKVPGNDLIAFDIPAPAVAPVTIQLTSSLPFITATTGTVTVDGYTQPGSRVNTATVGSNAVPGIELRGNGDTQDDDARQIGIYITSAGNTVRGLVIDDVYRGIMVDGPGAHDNTIVGNWIGFTGTGGTPTAIGNKGILLNTGANHNVIGTPNLADRNVIGNWAKGVDSYGPGTDSNTIQDNLFCIGPTGFTRATCETAVDHDFGPKDELLGGTLPNTRNVIGPTTQQGIEYSHGWDPNDSTDTTDTWAITGNQAIGNWIGFRGDGSYRSNFRSGNQFSSSDNDQGINVYDGSSDNLIEGNIIASVYDGIQVMAPNASGNIIEGNLIGVSPLGEPAPLTGWGIKLRWATTLDVIEGNTIRNAASGGIGLVNVNNVGAPQAVADNIRISQNIVTNTSGPAIYLAPTQSLPNQGANALLQAPAIKSAVIKPATKLSAAKLVIKGTGVVGATIEVYRATLAGGRFGLPKVYLGGTTVKGNGTWTLSLPSTASTRVTALQIAPNQDTSALAKNVTVKR